MRRVTIVVTILVLTAIYACTWLWISSKIQDGWMIHNKNIRMTSTSENNLVMVQNTFIDSATKKLNSTVQSDQQTQPIQSSAKNDKDSTMVTTTTNNNNKDIDTTTTKNKDMGTTTTTTATTTTTKDPSMTTKTKDTTFNTNQGTTTDPDTLKSTTAQHKDASATLLKPQSLFTVPSEAELVPAETIQNEFVHTLQSNSVLETYKILVHAPFNSTYASHIMPHHHSLQRDEFVALLRIQKTASKTVADVLGWMVQNIRASAGLVTKLADCRKSFGTSAVPLQSEITLQKNHASMDDVYETRHKYAILAAHQDISYWHYVHSLHDRPDDRPEHLSREHLSPEHLSPEHLSPEHLLENVWYKHLLGKNHQFKGLEKKAVLSKQMPLILSFNETLLKPWYKGAPLREYQVHWPMTKPQLPPHGCGAFDLPHVSAEASNACQYSWWQHVHIRDLYGSLWEANAILPEQIRLVVAIRHPVKRVASEIKHIFKNKGTLPWDYCWKEQYNPSMRAKRGHIPGPISAIAPNIDESTKPNDMQRTASSGTQNRQDTTFTRPRLRHQTYHRIARKLATVRKMPDSDAANFKKFMMDPQHAFGMRNRQTKMISGLVVEPYIPSLDQVDSLLKQHDFEMYDKQNDENSNIPSNRFSNPSSVDHTHEFKQYSKWARAAVNQAKFVLLNSTGIIVTERMVESLAVLFVSFDWRPPIQFENNKYFPASSISSDPFLSKPIHELKGLAQAKPLNSKAQNGNLPRNPKKGSKSGKKEHHAVSLTWSSLESHDVSMKVSKTNMNIPDRATAPSLHALFSRDGPDSVAWDRLLILCDALVQQFTIREKADKATLGLQIDQDLRNSIRAANHLDVELLTWADALLSTRVHLVKTRLANNMA